MHDRDAGTGGVTQYTGEIILTGTLITIESSGLNCTKSVDNLPHLSISPCPVSAGSFCGAQGVAACLQPRCRGSGEHFPLSHTVFILQIILEFSSFLWLFPFWKSNRVERRCILLFSFYNFGSVYICLDWNNGLYYIFTANSPLHFPLSRANITLCYITNQLSERQRPF